MLLAFLGSFGQNRSIAFQEKPWTEILTMAQTGKKMIFLDAYTSWCGPCKWMSANMFTQDSVADYYNSTFVCAHFDMEKGEGIQLAQRFSVRAYPTLLFISPEGEVVHMRVGAPQKVQDYLDMGKIALTPGEGFNSYQKRYRDGDRDPKFMIRYLDRLQGAYMPVDEPLKQYFASQKEDDLLNRDNWQLIYLYLSDTDSREFNYLVKHQKDFEKRYTPDSVNAKLSSVYLQSLTSYCRNRSFTDEGYQLLRKKILDTGFSDAGKVVFTADLNLYQMKGETEKFFALAVADLDTWYGTDYVMLNRMAWHFFQTASEQKYTDKATGWARTSVTLNSTSENNNTLANLLFKTGKKEEAIRYEKAAIDLALKEKVPTKQFEETLKKFESAP
jgi:thiol-disulfide isomerase/thioredoxin